MNAYSRLAGASNIGDMPTTVLILKAEKHTVFRLKGSSTDRLYFDVHRCPSKDDEVERLNAVSELIKTIWLQKLR
jgi:hypothetical protein